MNFSAFRFMCAEELAEKAAKLERRVEEMRERDTAIALSMLKQFEAALAAAKEELRRRACRSSS